MAIPVIETYEKNDGGTSASLTLTCDKPSEIAVGDLLLLICSNDDGSNVAQFSDNKVGWTFAGESGNSTIDAHIGAFYKIADGGEGTSESVTSESADRWCMFYLRISGSGDVEASNFTQSSASSSNHVIPAITTEEDDCLVICGLSFDGGNGHEFATPGGGYYTLIDQTTNDTNNGAYNSACWGYRNQEDQGSSGTVTINCSSSDGAAYFQIAFSPTSGAQHALFRFFTES